jgi:hypothetical protein
MGGATPNGICPGAMGTGGICPGVGTGCGTIAIGWGPGCAEVTVNEPAWKNHF